MSSRIPVRDIGGGGLGACVKVSQDSAVYRSIFLPKWGFFRNFRDIFTKTIPRITFHCIFINKLPKNFQKVLKNFARRIWRRENPFSQIFAPPPGVATPLNDPCPWGHILG